MAYTVKQLSNLSGVSVRTIHWYDHKAILKPAYTGANGYRYYEREQLLQLQQILFYRHLEFPLAKIKDIISRSGSSKIESLKLHRHKIVNDIDSKKQLLKTIDKIIASLKGDEKMLDEDLYRGFDLEKQQEYEKYIVKSYGTYSEKLLEQSKKNTAKWDHDEWVRVKGLGDKIHKDLATLIDQGFEPQSMEVQKIIDDHFELQNRFFSLTKEVYVGLTELYEQHHDFNKFLTDYHPKMVSFIRDAIICYANDNL